jgi:hypothetical protein
LKVVDKVMQVASSEQFMSVQTDLMLGAYGIGDILNPDKTYNVNHANYPLAHTQVNTVMEKASAQKDGASHLLLLTVDTY